MIGKYRLNHRRLKGMWQALFVVTALSLSLCAAAAELININKADEATLQNLNGVGPKKAAAIVQYRRQHGPFKRAEDLMQVPGIGEGILEKNRNIISTTRGLSRGGKVARSSGVKSEGRRRTSSAGLKPSKSRQAAPSFRGKPAGGTFGGKTTVRGFGSRSTRGAAASTRSAGKMPKSKPKYGSKAKVLSFKKKDRGVGMKKTAPRRMKKRAIETR